MANAFDKLVADGALDERTSTQKIVAGPYGHWYCIYGGELSATPQMADGPKPGYPADDEQAMRDGWYAPDDLQGEERAAVLAALGAEGVK